MKTPKRYPATMSVYVSKDELYEDRARWKRKNRIAQLKRIIEKYKEGTHLSSPLGAIYRRLQRVVRPGKHASSIKWANYLNELRKIQEYISCELTNTAIMNSFDAERKLKEERRWRNERDI